MLSDNLTPDERAVFLSAYGAAIVAMDARGAWATYYPQRMAEKAVEAFRALRMLQAG